MVRYSDSGLLASSPPSPFRPAFAGLPDWPLSHGDLSPDTAAQLALVQTEILDLVWDGGGQGIGFSLLDSIHKRKEVISKENGGLADVEGADAVVDKFVPGKDHIDLGKGEDWSEGIGWRVKDEMFNGCTLQSRRILFR